MFGKFEAIIRDTKIEGKMVPYPATGGLVREVTRVDGSPTLEGLLQVVCQEISVRSIQVDVPQSSERSFVPV